MLTSKQRAYLRGLANTTPSLYQIGKDGITDNVVSQLFDALEANELIKVNVLNNSMLDVRETLSELCRRLSANPVSAIGSKIIMYKPSSNPKNRNIVLPK